MDQGTIVTHPECQIHENPFEFRSPRAPLCVQETLTSGSPYSAISNCENVDVIEDDETSFGENPERFMANHGRYHIGILTSTPQKKGKETTCSTETPRTTPKKMVTILTGELSSSATMHRMSSSSSYNSERIGLISKHPSAANTSGLSVGSIICRICHEGESHEKLVSPCHCAGTMGKIHVTCAEKWLSSTNSNRCEICGTKYITRREVQSFMAWLRKPARQSDRRNLVGDMVCFLLLTPLAIISVWLCINGAAHYKHVQASRWEEIGLVTLAVFLAFIYCIWCTVSIRYHSKVYRAWQLKNLVVKIVATRPSSPRSDSEASSETQPSASFLSDLANNNTPAISSRSEPTISDVRSLISTEDSLSWAEWRQGSRIEAKMPSSADDSYIEPVGSRGMRARVHETTPNEHCFDRAVRFYGSGRKARVSGLSSPENSFSGRAGERGIEGKLSAPISSEDSPDTTAWTHGKERKIQASTLSDDSFNRPSRAHGTRRCSQGPPMPEDSLDATAGINESKIRARGCGISAPVREFESATVVQGPSPGQQTGAAAIL